MKETRICANCQTRMLKAGRYEKGSYYYLYLKCPKCGSRRKLLISEKIVDYFQPVSPDGAKEVASAPLSES